MNQAQRCSVAGPIWFAMPRSSPCGQGGEGTLARWILSGSAPALQPIQASSRRVALRWAFMGVMVKGEWKDVPRDTKSTGGAFVRPESLFRNAISRQGIYPPTGGRYRLYVSAACPWAHRTL